MKKLLYYFNQIKDVRATFFSLEENGSMGLAQSKNQLTFSKFILQDAQDAFLEQRREVALTEKISVIQKCIRMWAVRRRFLKMRGSCMVIQSRWRAYSARKQFLAVSYWLISFLQFIVNGVKLHGPVFSCLLLSYLLLVTFTE